MSQHIAAISASTALLISSTFGADIAPKTFSVEVPSWGSKQLELVCFDPLVPESFESRFFEQFTLCHAGVIAVQKNAHNQLSKDGLNIFFCSKEDKRFLVLVRQGTHVQRRFFATLPTEFIGQKARFFLPNLV